MNLSCPSRNYQVLLCLMPSSGSWSSRSEVLNSCDIGTNHHLKSVKETATICLLPCVLKIIIISIITITFYYYYYLLLIIHVFCFFSSMCICVNACVRMSIRCFLVRSSCAAASAERAEGCGGSLQEENAKFSVCKVQTEKVEDESLTFQMNTFQWHHHIIFCESPKNVKKGLNCRHFSHCFEKKRWPWMC